MSDLDFLLHCERLPNYRQMGRTTALAEACLKIDGVFLVSNESQKRDLRWRYPELDVRVCHATYLVGNRKPMIFDHYAIMMLLEEERQVKIRYMEEVDKLKAEKRKIMRKIEFDYDEFLDFIYNINRKPKWSITLWVEVNNIDNKVEVYDNDREDTTTLDGEII